jgi:predicted acetyltransferase
MKISLVEPSIKYKDSFLKGINEYFNMDEDIEGTGFIQKKLKNSYTDAEFNKEIIEIYKEHKKGVNLPSTD